MSAEQNVIGEQFTPICKADGITPAERYLKKLCDHSFLSLWSYPGIFRNQGRAGDKGDGKEVCDLLVVFENHIIIFSDKDCDFPNTGNVELDWSRWYRRAIQKSAEQVWGAERWILSYPDRLFLDRSCTVPFPIDLPTPDVAKVHRIVVAHAASKRCIQEWGGSGSLMLSSDILGEMHCAPRNKGGVPFAIGQIDPAKGFVHVFDDTTLNVVLKTLDTITDFVEYLEKKERLITNGQLIWAAGEDDLLAYYLKSFDPEDKHGFIIPTDIHGISIDEGFWDRFSNSPQRHAQLAANKISYAWDGLIETFAKHLLAGTSYSVSHSSLAYQERYFRFLARESRFKRRLLAQAFLELIWKTPKDIRATRTILPMNPDEPHYVFLLLPHPASVPYEQYRSVRGKLLANYCMITKLKCPDAQDIIGIATESGRREEGSEDITYLDGRLWDDKEQADAERLQAEMTELGLFGEYRLFKSTHKEYPDVPAPTQTTQGSGIPLGMKGRNRNNLCPCGSGKKLKKCCGH